MKPISFLSLSSLLLINWSALSQPNASQLTYANTITEASLKDHLSIIASDALEGRATGSRGQKMAAAFISHHFQQLGLTPPVKGSFYQPLALFKQVIGEVYVSAGSNRFDNYQDIVYLGEHDSNGEKQTEVAFVGLGSEVDFKNASVNGKAALIFHEATSNINMRELSKLKKRAHAFGATLVFFTTNLDEQKFRSFAQNAQSYFNSGIASLEEPISAPIDSGSFLITKDVASKILGSDVMALLRKAKSKSSALSKMKKGLVRYLTTVSTETTPTENVLGYLEGTDKKDELIVVTAHYDHIGKNEGAGNDVINNGADDDGSGTVAVMALANAFAQAKKNGEGPRRSMLFMTVTGEELGLFGSEYYVSNPVFPLTQTITNLNIDMIGRRDTDNEGKSDYVYVIGSDKLSTELHTLHEQVNKTYTNLRFDYVYNDEQHPERLYYRSDHWNFAKNNIPIIFYFDGIHRDYHEVSDEVEKIDFPLLRKRTQLVFHTAWELANREKSLNLK